MRKALLTILLVVVVILGAGLIGRQLPAGFIPDEDQGLLGVNVQLPPGASLERTAAVLTRVEQIVAKTEGVDSFATIGGFGLVTNTYQPNFGTILVRLKPWEERHGPALNVRGIMASLQREFVNDPRGDRLPLQHPDHLRLRSLGGLQVPPARPERHALGRGARRPDAASSSPPPASGPSWATSSPPSIRTTRR